MYCKNCDKLIDADERICHHCNRPSRRRTAGQSRGRSLMIALGILVAGIVLVAAWAVTFAPNTQTHDVNDEWWWTEQWTTRPDEPFRSEYFSVTLEMLAMAPDIFEGQLVVVRGELRENIAQPFIEEGGQIALISNTLAVLQAQIGNWVQVHGVFAGMQEHNGELVPMIHAHDFTVLRASLHD